MNNEHTQGPWKVEKHATGYDNRFTYDIIQAQPDVKFNCTLSIALGLGKKVDAHLIAAAPDLLDACEYVIEKLRDVKGKAFPISPILKAIKKAKGE